MFTGIDIAAAHEPDVVMTGFGTATVDGTPSLGEWDAARPLDFNVRLPLGGTTPARLLVMNDGENVYMAVRVTKPESVHSTMSWATTFDNDHDGTNEVGDDVLLVNYGEGISSALHDDHLEVCCGGNQLGGLLDTDATGGATNGSSAATLSGDDFVFEVSHPMNSADDDHDFSRVSGQRLGFRTEVTLWATDPSPVAHTVSLTTVFPASPTQQPGDIYISAGRPNTFWDSWPSAFVASTSAAFSFHGDALAAAFSCSLDSGPWSACASPKAYLGLSQGSHTVAVRAEDEVGYEDGSPATRTWTVDTVPPNTRIRSGPSGAVSSHRATFRFRSSDLGSTFRCKLNAHPWRGCTSPKTYRSLARGAHVFRVEARDKAGNVDPTPAVRRWTIL
jgi:hypothetical protein